jgi:heat shock protein HtpX
MADTRLQSVLIALLFTGICAGFGVLLGLMPLAFVVGFTVYADDPLPTIWQSAAILGGCGLLFALAYSPVLVCTWVRGAGMVTRRAGTRPVSSPEERRAANVVEEMALAAGAPAPIVAIIDDPALSCMSAGSRPTDATIALTCGLISALDRQAIQAVAAHELAHIINGDLHLNTYLAANSANFGAVADSVWNEVYVEQGRVAFLLPLARTGRWLTSVTSLAALRKRELLADYTAVMLTRDPPALVRALRKMADSPQQMTDIHRDLVNLYIVDPADPTSSGSGWRRSHPSLADRIALLERTL